MQKPTPLALRAAIAPIATAIKTGGDAGEAIRITLDLYPESEVVEQLLLLRGKELFVTLQEEHAL